MTVDDQLSELVQELETLIEFDGEYLSHQTALFLLGQTSQLPDELTIVSPRRRRNRQVGSRPLVFVFHSPDRIKPVQAAAFGKVTLTVSTLEKTLVDLLLDMDRAPDLKTLAALFARIPYKPVSLLQLAKQTSDTVLKRAAWFMGWAGRATSNEIPFGSFKRTPIKLDPRDEGGQIWDGRFFAKLPAFLFEIPPDPGPGDFDKEVLEWMELRSHPSLLGPMKEEGYLPLRGDNSPPAVKWLNENFGRNFLRMSPEEIEKVLLGNIEVSVESDKRTFPIMFSRWLLDHPETMEARREEILAWIRANLYSAALRSLEGALFYGNRFGLHEEVIASLAKNGYKLFTAGRFRLINNLCMEYLDSQFPLPHYIYVVAARSLAREDRFEESIEVIDRGKLRFEAMEKAELECGELAYAAGNVFRMMNRINEAMSELFLAREYFSSAKDHVRLATADCSLGNIYFARGQTREARTHYLSALSVMRSLGIKDSQASILGNIGLVEYSSGKFRHAQQYLSKAVALHKMLGNAWNESVASISLGKVLLSMGQFSRAMKILKESHHLRVLQKHESGIFETAALMGWICDMLGKSAAAKAWWDMVPPMDKTQIEPRAKFVIMGLQAMTALFNCRFADAMTLYGNLFNFSMRGEDSKKIEAGDSLHGLGVSQALAGNPAAPISLGEALEHFKENPLKSQVFLLKIFVTLYFPEKFPKFSIPELVEHYLEIQAFDPFWGLYAQKLLETRLPEAVQFLEFHLRKTPPSMLQLMLTRIPALKAVIRKLETRKNRTADIFTHLVSGTPHQIGLEEYREWRKAYPPNSFVFDGPAGIVAFKSNIAFLKPGSIPHGILNQLFTAFPHAVDVDALYRAVWGTEFDPECDPGAFKSSTQRLQKILRSVSPSVRLKRRRTRSQHGGIVLNLSCRWEAIL